MNKQEIIRMYRNQGCNVIPVIPMTKRPALESWDEYFTEKYDKEIPDDQNIGIVCGRVSDHLFVVDVDGCSDISYLDSILPNCLSETLVVKTGKGFHIYLKSIRYPDKTLRLDNHKIHVDIQAERVFVVGAGSLHESGKTYEIISETNQIKLVNFSDILLRLEELGYKPNVKQGEPPLPLERIEKHDVPEGLRHEVILWYAKHLLGTFQVNLDQIDEKILQWNSKLEKPQDEKELLQDVKDCKNFMILRWKEEGIDPDSPPKTTEKKEGKTRFKVKGLIGEIFVEAIKYDDEPNFLCVDRNGDLSITKSIKQGNTTFKPPESFGYFPYSFTVKEFEELSKQDYSKDEILSLIKNQVDYFISIEERDRILLAVDCLMSYSQEWIDTLHFLYCVGETESGKSTVLYLFKWLGYRCLFSDDLPNADIYNFLGEDEEAQGMIAEDEAQDIAYNKEKMTTYKSSYARGALKPRIKAVDSQNKTQVFYKTFCFKVFAGEYIPENKGFKERLAVLHMTEGLPKGNIKRPTDEEKKTLFLMRNRLLIWKLKTHFNKLPNIESGLTKRDQELWEDPLRVAHDTKMFEKFKDVIKFYTAQRHESVYQSVLVVKVVHLV